MITMAPLADGALHIGTPLATLLVWATSHPEIPVEYAEIGGEGIEIGLGAEGAPALDVAARTADALYRPRISVRLYAACARIAVTGDTGDQGADLTVNAVLIIRESDEAFGALITALPELTPGWEITTNAATLRAAHAAALAADH